MLQKRTICKEETESRLDSLKGRVTRAAETQLTCQRIMREKAMFQERNRGREPQCELISLAL